MVRSLWTAASGMIAQQENVDTIANNMANLNTTGYKSENAEFKSLLYQTLQTRSTNNAGERKPVSAQVGLGSRTAAISSVFKQGNLIASEETYDMAIEGDGFFKVQTPGGQIQYTRDGNFAISPVEGGALICTADGDPILDQYNNSMIIPSGYNPSTLAVSSEGYLSVMDDKNNPVNLYRLDQNGQPLYQIRIGLVQFNNPVGLEKVSGNKFAASVASGQPMEEGMEGNNIVRSKIHQQYLEASNVQVAEEMVDLIVAQRAYEMNSKIIQASDEMLQQANNLRR